MQKIMQKTAIKATIAPAAPPTKAAASVEVKFVII